MKKIFTFCFFAFTLLIGTQSAMAQDNNAEINEKAIIKAKEVRALVKFDNKTLEQVYIAFQTYENKTYSINKHLTSGTSDFDEATLQTNQKLQANLKTALGPVLFKRYLVASGQEQQQ